MARKIDVLKDTKVAMQINVTEANPAGLTVGQTFEVRGHEWARAFTDEARKRAGENAKNLDRRDVYLNQLALSKGVVPSVPGFTSIAYADG